MSTFCHVQTCFIIIWDMLIVVVSGSIIYTCLQWSHPHGHSHYEWSPWIWRNLCYREFWKYPMEWSWNLGKNTKKHQSHRSKCIIHVRMYIHLFLPSWRIGFLTFQLQQISGSSICQWKVGSPKATMAMPRCWVGLWMTWALSAEPRGTRVHQQHSDDQTLLVTAAFWRCISSILSHEQLHDL